MHRTSLPIDIILKSNSIWMMTAYSNQWELLSQHTEKFSGFWVYFLVMRPTACTIESHLRPHLQVPAQTIVFTLWWCQWFQNRSTQLKESFTNRKLPWTKNSRVITSSFAVWGDLSSFIDVSFKMVVLKRKIIFGLQHHEWPLHQFRSNRGRAAPSSLGFIMYLWVDYCFPQCNVPQPTLCWVLVVKV